MKAGIITIGDEILIGQIVDTNSAWIAKKLTETGFEVNEMASIADKGEQIKNTIREMFTRVDVILMTGGIGPTKDDITKKTLCEYFNTTLVFDENVLKAIEGVISGFTSLNELTRNQAYVPKDCTVIANQVGTAPITWFERENKVLVSMPGVPHEMRYNMENEILPRLLGRFNIEAYLSCTFIVAGYTESALAIHLTDFENSLPEDFGLAYLPSPGIMKLRLFVKGEDRRQELENQVRKLESLLGKAILAEKDILLERILGDFLLEREMTLGTAESCTGGNIAHMITATPGASKCFTGSIVSYSNDVKKNILGVSAESLEKYGAVSEAVVKEMALGACKVLETDCSIATSGIAGPDGGTPDKPVGTVWIGTSYKGKVLAKKYSFGKHRESNILRASNAGIIQLLQMLKEENL